MITRSAGYLFICNKRALLAHSTNSRRNMWMPPKGHVEAGESDLEAAIREFTEETGIHPNFPLQPTSSFTVNYTDKIGKCYKQVIIFVQYIEDETFINEKQLQEEEIDALAWISLQDLPTFSFWRYTPFIENYLNK